VFACEKLDGCRGYWDGSRMWSRSGRAITIPAHWAAKLPRMHLDGEFFAGRGQWDTTVAAVARNRWTPQVCFMVFDAPKVDGCWSKRIAAVKTSLRCDFAAAVPYETVADLVHVSLMFRRVRAGGGEGLILRRPGAGYILQHVPRPSIQAYSCRQSRDLVLLLGPSLRSCARSLCRHSGVNRESGEAPGITLAFAFSRLSELAFPDRDRFQSPLDGSSRHE
jgi:hypothetical protein